MAKKEIRVCVGCSCEDFVQSRQEIYRCRGCRMKDYNRDPEKIRKRAESFKKTASDPEWKSRASERAVEREKNPEVREKRSSSVRKAYSDPSLRERLSHSIKEAHARADVKERHRAACIEAQNRPETAARKSESLKLVIRQALNRPERRIANSIRQGGDGDLKRIDRHKIAGTVWVKSEGYKWSRAVKERDCFTCQHCGSNERKHLHAHHIKSRAGYPELALEVGNGVTLCKPCHLAEHKRIREEKKSQ